MFLKVDYEMVATSCETSSTCQASGAWDKETLSKCTDNAVCDLVIGERTCVCTEGYAGDGYVNCTLTAEGQGKRKCHGKIKNVL